MTGPDTARPDTARRDYGPVQVLDRLGLEVWQFERARRAGLIPAADPSTGRWPAVVVEAIAADMDRIRAAVGAYPDVGAIRAAQILTDRFGIEVRADTVAELARKGLLPMVGEYRGHPVYDGQALEAFTDLAALRRAVVEGRLLARGEVAAVLGVRVCDLAHLIEAHWLEPVAHVHSVWQRRRAVPAVALFRAGDVEVLAHHPGIDWDAVRATPPGRSSPLAVLTAARRTRRGPVPPPPTTATDPDPDSGSATGSGAACEEIR